MKHIVLTILLISIVGIASAEITAFNDVTVVDGSLATLTWSGTSYSAAQLVLGTTTRYYNNDQGGVTAWLPEGSEVPGDLVAVSGTSNAKVDDVGSHADNFLWAGADISSLDGLVYQETIFATPTDTIFVFERGGNDSGTIYGITGGAIDGGTALDKTIHYGTIGNFSGQTDKGYVVQFDTAVDGIRIAASGHDSLTVTTIPEPATMSILALGGLLALRRRRK